jgi:hypothetical protein
MMMVVRVMVWMRGRVRVCKGALVAGLRSDKKQRSTSPPTGRLPVPPPSRACKAARAPLRPHALTPASA